VKDVLLLAVRALNGGTFVVAFSLLAEVLKPKRFAGLFSAAPSVALANLAVDIAANGHGPAVVGTQGMEVGATALVLSCLAGIALIRRWGALRASVAICAAWVAIAVAGYQILLHT
jgi:hypothetical protein